MQTDVAWGPWLVAFSGGREAAKWCSYGFSALRHGRQRCVCAFMKVMFTAKEYTRLLELVYLGSRVVAGTRPPEEENPHLARYHEIQQKLFDLATPLGCGDLVTVASNGLLAPSEKLVEDERLRKIEGDSANDLFWHELVARLADRDLAAEQARGHAVGKDGPPIDADARLKEIEDAYWDEFEKHDLAHFVLLRGAKG